MMKSRIFKIITFIFILILISIFVIFAYRQLRNILKFPVSDKTTSETSVETTSSEGETKIDITSYEKSEKETKETDREADSIEESREIKEFFKDKESLKNILNEYTVQVKFLPEDMQLECKLQLEYTNFEDDKLDKLYFHLYPRAYDEYSDDSFKIITDLTGKDLNELDIVPGKMEITKLLVNGTEINYKIEQTLCEIDLEKPINPDENLEITIEFYQNIPKNTDRYGYYKDVVSLGNWCPILAVYDDNGWHKDPFLPIGDPFYSDSSIYEVEISLTENYVLASTGELINTKKADDYISYTYEAYPVRDFAIMFSKDYIVLEDKYQDINIYSYLVDEDLEKNKNSLNFAKDSIAIFSELLGKYPYQNYSIAQNFMNFGGMEYPQLCQIKYADYDDKNISSYRNELVIAHETAHQWWYSVVGNDEINEPWLDEAFAVYSTHQYFINKYSETDPQFIYSQRNRTIQAPLKVMSKTIRDYEDFGEYSAEIYKGGSDLLFKLEEHLGKEVMYEILRRYYEEYKFENADITGFINICEEVSEKDLSEFFSPYFDK